MQAHKALKALVLTFILGLGSVTSVLSIPHAQADDAQGVTTLYFTDALDFENTSDLGFAYLSETPPMSQNDSQYPPNLFIKNTSKFIPKYEVNGPKWITWLTATWAFSILDEIPDFENMSGIFDDFELFMPSPYRVIEAYVYSGNDSILINGDISFSLYFQQPNRQILNSLPQFQDSVNIAFYSMDTSSFFPKLIQNKTVALKPAGLASIYKQQITLTNISYAISPGDNLIFSVEILPSNKTGTNFIKNRLDIEKRLTRWQTLANILENFSRLPKIQTIGTSMKEILLAVKEINISAEDFANIYTAIASSKLVYGSLSYPSSVTIPARIIEQDVREYFLGSNQEMSQNPPDNSSTIKSKLTAPLTWTTTPALTRNKIVKLSDVSAYLYFYRPFRTIIGKISIVATLYDDNTTLATSTRQLTRQEMQTLLSKAKHPIVITFAGNDTEISYGHHLRLTIALSSTTFPLFKLISLQYNSVDYPSSLRVKFQETNNIKIHDINTTIEDGKIIPGGSAQYTLNVTSKKADTVQIRTIEREKTGTWEVHNPTTMIVSANSWITIPVYVNSTNSYKEAYGDTINLIVEVSGNTGIARQSIATEVSTDAISYKLEILQYSQNINISKGQNHNFYFVIKNNNTGAIDDADSYTVTASSLNHWSVIPLESIRNVRRGSSTRPDEARVVIKVPEETTLDSDVITITVASVGDPSATATITVTAHVNPDDFLESIYAFFDSAAEQLGLNEIFGSDGAWVLLIILVVIILFLCIILALVLTTKPVRVICTDRIKEIEATQNASYDVTLQNRSKKSQTFEIKAEPKAPTTKWTTAVEPSIITIDGRQSGTVNVITTPTDQATAKDWTEVIVSVSKTGRKRTEKITVLTTMKEGKTVLQLSNISHWPATFNPGERVVTACSVSNSGTLTARNVKVFFYLNGKQKNTVDVTIPPGNIADIQIPWIAEKGKNKVRIRVKE